jgi:hypothetical protein
VRGWGAGGEDLDYDFISFTARSEETKQREGHVFDCDIQSDAVMEALGQAFSLARELQAQAGTRSSSLGTTYVACRRPLSFRIPLP